MESKNEIWRVKVGIAFANLLVLIVLIGSGGLSTASASTTKGESTELSRVTDVIQKTRTIILTKYDSFSSTDNLFGIGNEWTLMGLARDDIQTQGPLYERYYNDAVTKVTATQGTFPNSSPTDYAREIIALTALGYDPTDIGGYNLFTGISNYKALVNQGVNSMSFALIAATLEPDFDFVGTGNAETDVTKARLVGGIISKQQDTGLWFSDPDRTSMALQALAQVQGTDLDADGAVTAAIEKGEEALKKLQNPNGSYSSWNMENSSSSAQVLTALSQLGISPTSAEFTKGGHTVVDDVLSYFIDGAGFEYKHGGGYNGMANEQCYYALIAYRRYLQGENRLYDMSDSELGTTQETSPETPPATDPEDPAGNETGDNDGNGETPTNPSETGAITKPAPPTPPASDVSRETDSVVVQYAAPENEATDTILSRRHGPVSSPATEEKSTDNKSQDASDWDFNSTEFDESASSFDDGENVNASDAAPHSATVTIPVPWAIAAGIVLVALVAATIIVALRTRKAV